MAKTRDGLKIPKLVKMLENWGITIREGTNHPYIAKYENMRPCPIARSTDAERMLAPWVSQALNLNRKEVYSKMRNYC